RFGQGHVLAARPRSNSANRRRSSRTCAAKTARGSPGPAIASCFHASNSAGYSPRSRHQALRVLISLSIRRVIFGCSGTSRRPAPPTGLEWALRMQIRRVVSLSVGGSTFSGWTLARRSARVAGIDGGDSAMPHDVPGDPCSLTATRVVRLIQEGKLRPEALMEAY